MKYLSDEEIFRIAMPIWKNMNECSNGINYEGFSKKFSEDLKKRITKNRFEEQCEKFELLTSLKADAEPIACIRRKEGFAVIFRQYSAELEGEFMGSLVLSISEDEVEVMDAAIY